ncbi:MAG TPA: MFS transporter [Chroococcidiopsis sp.]
MPVGKTYSEHSESGHLDNPLPRRSARKHSHVFVILLAAGCLTTMTGGVVSPVLPEMVQQLQFDPRWAGMLVSVHALAIAVFTPIMGILADRIGKLKVMIPALLCYALFGVAGAFLPNFGALLATRALLGISSGGIAAASIGLLGNLYEGEERSRILGFATSAMTTASIMFPLLGGWVGRDHWQHAFYLYGFGIPLAIIAAIGLRQPRSPHTSVGGGGQRDQLLRALRQPGIIQIYLLLASAAMIVYAVVIYTPLYLKAAIGAGPELNGLVLAVRGMGAATVSALLAARVASRLGSRQAIAIGFSLMAVTVGTIPLLNQISSIIPVAVLFGAGFGIITPNAYNSLANLSHPSVRASVLAIGTGFNSLGQFISPLILGPLWKYSGLPLVFYVTAAIAISTAGLSLMRRQTE